MSLRASLAASRHPGEPAAIARMSRVVQIGSKASLIPCARRCAARNQTPGRNRLSPWQETTSDLNFALRAFLPR